MSPSSLALLHRFDVATHAFFLPAAAVAFLLWLATAYLFLNVRRDWQPIAKLPPAYLLTGAGFVSIVLYFVVAGSAIETLVLSAVRPILFSKVSGVTVNGQTIADPQTLVTDLRKLPNGSDHHSHPIKVFRVVLQTAKGPLTLDLERDSGDPTEYWVYDPDFRKCYLGKIHTGTLDAL
jgi:hypothetical protein